jgi:hypothetical protein
MDLFFSPAVIGFLCQRYPVDYWQLTSEICNQREKSVHKSDPLVSRFETTSSMKLLQEVAKLQENA